MSVQALRAAMPMRQRSILLPPAWPPVLRRRVVFYAILLALNVLAMSEGLFTIALWMMVLPIIPLLIIQWATLYLPLIDWPLTAWKHTRNLGLTAAWLGAALVLPLGVPVAFNLWQLSLSALALSGDRTPELKPVPQSILITGECGQHCLALIKTGAVATQYRDETDTGDWKTGSLPRTRQVFASTYCDKGRSDRVDPLRDQPGWCIVNKSVEQASFDTVVRFAGFGNLAKPSEPRRIEVWRCENGCRLVARRTERQILRMAAPLTVAYPNAHEFSLDPQWRRKRVVMGDADPLRVLPQLLAVDMSAGRPIRGENTSLARMFEETRQARELADRQLEELKRLRFLEEQRAFEQAEHERLQEAKRLREQRIKQGRTNCQITEDPKRGTFRSICPDL